MGGAAENSNLSGAAANREVSDLGATEGVGEVQEEPFLGGAEGLEIELRAAREEVSKYQDLYVRAQAEMENYRKRAAREKEEAVRYANTRLLDALLPIFDNFELGLEAAQQATDAGGVVQGMAMVRRQLEDFLRDHHVEVVDATGQAFDHNLHEAVGQDASEEVPEGYVLRQLRRGFKVKDRLLRPASVIVSQGPAVPPLNEMA